MAADPLEGMLNFSEGRDGALEAKNQSEPLCASCRLSEELFPIDQVRIVQAPGSDLFTTPASRRCK